MSVKILEPVKILDVCAAPSANPQGEPGDPILTEVIRHGLNATAEQMKVVLRRTAFSPVIYEAFPRLRLLDSTIQTTACFARAGASSVSGHVGVLLGSCRHAPRWVGRYIGQGTSFGVRAATTTARTRRTRHLSSPRFTMVSSSRLRLPRHIKWT